MATPITHATGPAGLSLTTTGRSSCMLHTSGAILPRGGPLLTIKNDEPLNSGSSPELPTAEAVRSCRLHGLHARLSCVAEHGLHRVGFLVERIVLDVLPRADVADLTVLTVVPAGRRIRIGDRFAVLVTFDDRHAFVGAGFVGGRGREVR